MKAAKATIEALLNATEDSGILIDLEGRFIALNHEAARRRNSTVEDLIGKNVFDFLEPHIADQRRECIREVIRAKRSICASEEFGDRHYRVSFYPVLDDSGMVASVASYSRDCTEARKHEEELLRAREVAESASMAKTQFLSNLSHELRTPLNGILGISQIALDETLDLETRNNFEMILESGQRLLHVLNNLLDLAAFERRSIQPVIKEFDLPAVLDSLRNSFSLQANLGKVDLEFMVQPGLPRHWHGDEFRLGQILANLISNALRCTTDGFVRVTVESCGHSPGSKDDSPGWNKLRFVVADSGPGIDEKVIGSVFDSFTIAENFMTKRHSGAGIGLSIVRGLVEMLGGTVHIDSGKDKGTIIAFTIPLAVSESPHAENRNAPRIRPSHRRDKTRVLVVEDDPINLFTTTRILTRCGFDVREAANGQEAIDLLHNHQVDLILMDIHMPVMDGLQASTRIRDGEIPGIDRHIPIIALTSNVMQRDRDRLAQSGISDCIIKPVSASQISAILPRHLGSP